MARTVLQKYRSLRSELEKVRFELNSHQQYLELLLKKRKMENKQLHDAHNEHFRNPSKINYDAIESITYAVVHNNSLIKMHLQKCKYYKGKAKVITTLLSKLLK